MGCAGVAGGSYACNHSDECAPSAHAVPVMAVVLFTLTCLLAGVHWLRQHQASSSSSTLRPKVKEVELMGEIDLGESTGSSAAESNGAERYKCGCGEYVTS